MDESQAIKGDVSLISNERTEKGGNLNARTIINT